MKRAVITGATGAIGIALVEELLKREMKVTVILRPDSGRKERMDIFESYKESGRIHIEEYSLDMLEQLDADKLGESDMFFHLAWMGTIGSGRDDMGLQLCNVQYTLSAVHLAKRLGCKVFIGVGSQAELGRVEGKIRPDTPAFPEMGYGIAKLCAGQMSRLECRKLGIRHEWARVLSVYGPYDGEQTMIISGIRTMLNGGIPKFSRGEQEWDYLYSTDAARAIMLIGMHGQDGIAYPVGSGRTRKLTDYIEIMRRSVGEEARVEIGGLSYKENQVMYLCADIESLTTDTGFYPQVSFEDGIRQTIDWCKECDIDLN